MSLTKVLQKELLFQGEIGSADELSNIVIILKSKLSAKSCILLKGDLAAGKTTFVQKFCESFAIKSVSSPTFSLHQIYNNGVIQIDHFDLYRLNSPEEVETSGVWEALNQESGLVFIEWPERLSQQELPLDWTIFEVDITIKNSTATTTGRFFSLSRFFR